MDLEYQSSGVGLTTVYKCPDGTDFPVDWEDVADEKLGWFWDQVHCPLPLTPLSVNLWREIDAGFRRGFDVSGAAGYLEFRNFHGYSFARLTPFDDDAAVRTAIRERDLALREECLVDTWRREYEPESKALTRSLRSLASDLDRVGVGNALDQARAVVRRLGELHMLATGPMTNAADRFIRTCSEEFGAEGEQIAADLMGGFFNKSVESATKLWDLAQAARESPHVEKLIKASSPDEVQAMLPQTRGGAEFGRLLDEYLEVYGLRTESFSELSHPTWRERPHFPILMIRRFIDSAETASPAYLHRLVQERREKRLQEVQPTLSSRADVWERFQREMAIAQQRTVIIEDHNFYIDQQGPASLRQLCRAVGASLLERGAVDSAADVFYLHEVEIRMALQDGGGPFSSLVADRRADRERWMRVLPPASLGSGPVKLPDGLQRFWGIQSGEPISAKSFKGIPGSAGRVRGIARVVLALGDIDRLGPGEVLVTHATAPPWTPAFAIAGGIVTDSGGALSHCAVVAREYGIPAVVGARIATSTIRDGAIITVDGSSGIVLIED